MAHSYREIDYKECQLLLPKSGKQAEGSYIYPGGERLVYGRKESKGKDRKVKIPEDIITTSSIF